MSFHMDAQIVRIDKLDFDFKYKIRRAIYEIHFLHIMYQKIQKINFYVINSNGNHINTAILY